MGYIHEIEDWPKFRWDAAVVGPALARVRHQQGRLLGRMEALGFSVLDEATLATLTQDVLTTSAIEGEVLNKEQVRSSLAQRLGVDIGALTPADREVEGIVEVMLDATQRSAEALSAERLFGWHALLFPSGRSGFSRIVVGNWRDDATGRMRVVSGAIGRERVHFEAPSAERVAGEMERFIAWFNGAEGMDLVLKAGVTHLWFVTVHPFADGNGRIARALADMLLARSEGTPRRFYSMSAQIREERNDYYAILESVQKGSMDITSWLTWFLGCLGRAIEAAEGVSARVLQRARFWERHAGESFNGRQRAVLNRVLQGFEGKLTSSKWAKLAKCSADTALRDIEDLMRRGILQRNAGGGRSTSYSVVGEG